MTKIETNSELALVLPVLFGNERALSNELLGLACDKKSFSLQDGRAVIPTSMETLADDVAFFNLSSRIAERVWLQLGSARTEDFDQLFEETRRIPWNKYLNKDAAFTVTGYSRNSALTSVPACQRVIKKAIVKSLLTARGMPENAKLLENPARGEHEIQFSLVDDVLSLMIDTSGEPLHKRSYRRKSNLAPLRETTAAALLEYSYLTNVLRHGGMVIDLFTGSGTLIIEAAQIALDLAPGRLRTFAAEDLQAIGPGAFKDQRRKIREKNPIIDPKDKTRFLALDIDAGAVEAAQANARSAQVDELIKFERRDSTKIDFTEVLELAAGREILFLANPPYGERMEDEEEARSIAVRLGRWLARPLREQKTRLSLSLITAEDHFESDFGLKAKKRRKLYNGPLACTLYNFY
ncbi:MAG TPA: class I SAM-dependent RNA methyltransferase [Oscillospiraceae bacterium]|nr:class I SAM-dependent RNA methyltransferase [Oscillospiraceae bacterium]